MVSSLLSVPDLIALALYNHINPVTYHFNHHHVKYGGGQRVSLRHPPEAL